MPANFQGFLRGARDVAGRIFAVLVLLIGCQSFAAGEEQPVPELNWGSASTLSAAEQAYNERRYQDAIRLYTEASKNSSEQSAALLGRGMAHEMVNQTQKAVEDYKRAIDVDRKNYRAMENLAGIYERGGRYISEAITLYQHALKLDPRPEWKENLAVWIAMLETRLKPQTSSAVGCWHLANRKAKAGDSQAAEALYTKAIKLNPAMFQAYFNRGLLRGSMGNQSGAVADFGATVRMSPTFRGGFVQKGLTHEQMGNRAQARHDLEQAVKVDPRDPEAFYHLARLLENTNEHARAAQLYQGALGLRPRPELRKLIMDRIAGLPATIKSDAKKGSSPTNDLKQLW
jgi:tetratricopeptide (TPR) repeat protein